LENIYSSVEQPDSPSVKKAIGALRSEAPSLEGTLVTVGNRFDSFVNEATALQRGWSIDVGEATANQMAYRLKEFLFLAGIVYEIAFLILGVRALRKYILQNARLRLSG
jgi:hypothetical protein